MMMKMVEVVSEIPGRPIPASKRELARMYLTTRSAESLQTPCLLFCYAVIHHPTPAMVAWVEAVN
jgi:hypothetical protein